MPDHQVPIVPLSDDTQLHEIMSCIESILNKIADYPAGVFLFCVVPRPAWKDEALKMPETVSKLLVVILDESLIGAARTSMEMIEHKDRKRLGNPPEKRAKPLKFRPQMSFRQVYGWLDAAPATITTFTFQGEGHVMFLGFVQGAETVHDFLSEFTKATKTSDSVN